MHSDAQRWNVRYSRPDKTYRFDADAVLVKCERLLPATGLALEIACGTAGNALWLAGKGFHCVAVDVSHAGLRLARAEARRRGVELHLVVADALRLPFTAGGFDVVIVTRFLERDLFPHIRALTRPGGCVFYRTFNQLRRYSQPSFNPEYLLGDGELSRVFEGFQRLAGNEGPTQTEDSSYLLARCPDRQA